jgi:hypothetical protein
MQPHFKFLHPTACLYENGETRIDKRIILDLASKIGISNLEDIP